jgi:hypothetical protein
MRPEILLNTCVAALRLDGCGSEAIAFLLAESAVDALTAAGLRAEILTAASNIWSAPCASARPTCAPCAVRRP